MHLKDTAGNAFERIGWYIMHLKWNVVRVLDMECKGCIRKRALGMHLEEEAGGS